ncbi:hypothetical protein N658DRAFT_97720 [Parathielavia hyrcaniae]|uniref:Uncharacterized protein n=1 Tax=Parathielavia hyrcaniae TaxID=113614 RepID=A0AAN6Q412_9PEZI|nr:hypothetical protein N658DRAFT_97720 [Parathielavia hyrcaniae]
MPWIPPDAGLQSSLCCDPFALWVPSEATAWTRLVGTSFEFSTPCWKECNTRLLRYCRATRSGIRMKRPGRMKLELLGPRRLYNMTEEPPRSMSTPPGLEQRNFLQRCGQDTLPSGVIKSGTRHENLDAALMICVDPDFSSLSGIDMMCYLQGKPDISILVGASKWPIRPRIHSPAKAFLFPTAVG